MLKVHRMKLNDILASLQLSQEQYLVEDELLRALVRMPLDVCRQMVGLHCEVFNQIHFRVAISRLLFLRAVYHLQICNPTNYFTWCGLHHTLRLIIVY